MTSAPLCPFADQGDKVPRPLCRLRGHLSGAGWRNGPSLWSPAFNQGMRSGFENQTFRRLGTAHASDSASPFACWSPCSIRETCSSVENQTFRRLE